MNTYFKIGLKFIVLALILIALNFLYKFTLLKSDIQKYSPIINKVTDVVNENCEIVYLGESSNVAVGLDDLDKRTISDLIADYFPLIKTGAITKEASHANIFYELLKKIPENSAVKTVIVTLNMRSFNATWICSPLETPLQKSLVLLKDNPALFNRFKLAFKWYPIISDSESEKKTKKMWRKEILKFPYEFEYSNVIDWDKGQALRGVKNQDGTRNEELSVLACHYVKTYAFQIDTTSNPRIKDFDHIVQLAEKRNWHLIFNLLGENTEKADSLVGRELLFLMKQNRDLLVNRYNRKGVMVVDNLEAVSSEDYLDKKWTTEHYAERGRRIIAAKVADCLKVLYPEDYASLGSSTEKVAAFYNDCEGKTVWSQMQTLTLEKAFSGKRASKVGQGKEYSIGLEYPVKGLIDSLTNLTVDLRVFQNTLTHDAKLVFELVGEKSGHQWNGYRIADLTGTTNSWQLISKSISLPKEFYSAELFKVYVWNTSSDPIYVDDFRIAFDK